MVWYTVQIQNIIVYTINTLIYKLKWNFICTALYLLYSITAIQVPNDSILGRWMKRTITMANNMAVRIANDLEKIIQVNRKRPKLRKKSNRGSNRKQHKITAFTVLAMQASSTIGERVTQFDTDSVPIGIDNRCSACISHKAEDFIGELKDTTKTIKGFAGSRTTNVKVGTLSWTWDDDNGIPHKFIIPKSYYVPQGKVRLLSPQHWAKSQRKHNNKRGGKPSTLSQTTDENVTLIWDQRRHRLTVPLSPVNNVASFHLSPGFSNYYAFCSEAGVEDYDESDPIICNEIVGDEIDDLQSHTLPSEEMNNEWKREGSMLDGKTKILHPASEGGEDANAIENDAAALLHYHKNSDTYPSES